MVKIRVLNSCDTVGSWVESAQAGTPVPNATILQEGAGSLEIPKTKVAHVQSTWTNASIPPIDISGNHKVYFWLYIKEAGVLAKLNYITIFVGSDSSNYVSVNNTETLVVGWNKIESNVLSPDTTTGTPSFKSVSFIMLNVIAANLGDSWSGDELIMDWWYYEDIFTGDKGTAAIATRYPIESGLQARTTRQHGRTMNLVAESSVIPKSKREGL